MTNHREFCLIYLVKPIYRYGQNPILYLFYRGLNINVSDIIISRI